MSLSSPTEQQTITPAGGTPVPPTTTTDAAPRRVRDWRWGSMPVWLRRVLVVVLLLTGWQLYVTVSGVNPLLFSSPADVGKALVAGFQNGELLRSTGTTMRVLLLGMLFGSLIAVVLTTLAVWTRFGEDVLVVFSSMLNPLPSIAVLPLAILWFGLSETALVFVVANAVIWPIAINVNTGFRTANRTILAVGRNIGLKRWRMISEVLFPAALPHTISGVKTAWAFGWRTIVASELVFGVAGGGGGLGYFINNSRYYLDIPDVFAGLVTIAVIGLLIDMVFILIERRTVVRWGMKT
ncbi:ABC transporter permease [Verrucosispora sp. WMMD573]|uniref:ABC transporter permease n=1 Tax=Verrucosispora sp. WMMD573 TaxID=3015149 RepID=UPI00248AEC1D|nr:ABC transporter permease [Verrucosispora sp. WMMD573]WBB52679.1 ABC transporter permease [Verrucosispora sp. WMMD573]